MSLFLGVVLGGAFALGACGSTSSPDADEGSGQAGDDSGGTSGSGGKGGKGGTSGSAGSTSGGKGGRGGSSSGGSGNVGGGGEGGSIEPPDTCRADLDCQAAGLLCDPLTSECVECLLDNACPEGEECKDRRCKPVIDCDNSLDCADDPSERVCDVPRGRCVECLGPADCPENHDCTANRCVPFDPCQNSLDCPQGRVCDAMRGRCVGCLADADCLEAERCVSNQCRVRCVSDNTCTPLGMLCNLSGGHCVSCLEHADCPDAYHCSQGDCVVDRCVGGSARCEGNTRATCRAPGDDFDRAACAGRQTCVESGTTASCTDWVCTAGQIECDASARNVIRCSDDGLSVEGTTNCEMTGEICVAGDCRDLACVPSARYCDGETIRQCSADGLASMLVQSCGSSQFCDDATVTCRAWVCTPNQPWCNGTLAQVCNGRGSGSVGAGTDCAATAGRQCSNGACLCATNRVDCDMNAGTGCEVNVSTDPAHCGGCSMACSTNHVPAQSCSASTCNGACETGYSDCNSDKRTDGCETNTTGDVNNCGACARVCSTNHVTPNCGSSTCNGACQGGYSDCNGNKQTDGCESDTLLDPSNCGGCSQSCSTLNMATLTCGSGNCNGTCVSGFDDCNGNKRADGCETDVRYDENNCGACGDPCPMGQSCVNQVCTTCNNSVLLLGDGTTVANSVLQTALEAEGLVVTLINTGVTSYSNSPVATNFGAILALSGVSYETDMPAAGQSAIVAANAGGTGFVSTEWAAYQASVGRWLTLRQLVLMTRTTATTGTTSYTLTAANHPLWTGLPPTFSSSVSMAYNSGVLANGGTTIATCTACTGVGAGVVAKDTVGGAGRIVYLAHAASYQSAAWHTDANLVRMFTNSAKWATGCFL